MTYGMYSVTMPDGYTMHVNASSCDAAKDAVLNAKLVNAPKCIMTAKLENEIRL